MDLLALFVEFFMSRIHSKHLHFRYNLILLQLSLYAMYMYIYIHGSMHTNSLLYDDYAY